MFLHLIYSAPPKIECNQAVQILNPLFRKYPLYQDIFLTCYENAFLGSGNFGVIFKVLNKKTTETLALKFQQYPVSSTVEIQSLDKELEALAILDHVNFPKLHFSIPNDSGDFKQYFIAMDFIDKGSLTKWKKDNPSPGDARLGTLFFYLLNGLNYLRELNMAHLDIKEDNIMMTNKYMINPLTDKPEMIEFPVYVDFGLADVINQPLNLIKGTPLYMDPEFTFFNSPPGDPQTQQKVYSHLSDVYSLGIVFYRLLFNNYPFNGKDFPEIAKQAINDPLSFPAGVNLAFVFLISKMINPYEANRRSANVIQWYFKEFMKHPIIFTPQPLLIYPKQPLATAFFISEYSKRKYVIEDYNDQKYQKMIKNYKMEAPQTAAPKLRLNSGNPNGNFGNANNNVAPVNLNNWNANNNAARVNYNSGNGNNNALPVQNNNGNRNYNTPPASLNNQRNQLDFKFGRKPIFLKGSQRKSRRILSNTSDLETKNENLHSKSIQDIKVFYSNEKLNQLLPKKSDSESKGNLFNKLDDQSQHNLNSEKRTVSHKQLPSHESHRKSEVIFGCFIAILFGIIVLTTVQIKRKFSESCLENK